MSDPIQWNTISVLLFATVVQGLFLTLFVLIKSKQTSHFLLAGLLLLITLRAGNYMAYITEINQQFPHLYGIPGPFAYLIPPLYFFFVRMITRDTFRFRWRDLLHGLLFLLFLALNIPNYMLQAEQKLMIIQAIISPERVYSWLAIFFGDIFSFQFLIYLGILIWNSKKEEANGWTDHQKVALLNKVLFAAIFLSVLTNWSMFALGIPGGSLEYLQVTIWTLIVHLIGYTQLSPITQSFNKKKYSNSSLDHAQMQMIKTELVNYFEQEEPYLESGLRLKDVSEKLDVPGHHLSQVLSQELEMTFHDFVNSYRIQTAQEKLKNENLVQYTLLAVAYDSGFSNKSSFNRAFKKFTGQTPSDFLKNSSE